MTWLLKMQRPRQVPPLGDLESLSWPGLTKPLELGKVGPIPWRAGGRQQVADHLRRVRFGHAAIFVYPVDW